MFLLVAGLRPVKDPLYLAASIAGVCNVIRGGGLPREKDGSGCFSYLLGGKNSVLVPLVYFVQAQKVCSGCFLCSFYSILAKKNTHEGRDFTTFDRK